MSTCDGCGGACCGFVKIVVAAYTPDEERWASLHGCRLIPVKERPGAFAMWIPTACTARAPGWAGPGRRGAAGYAQETRP